MKKLITAFQKVKFANVAKGKESPQEVSNVNIKNNE